MLFRFAWLLLLVSCGGQLIGDADAGDAAIPKDASEASPTDDGGGFACGETGHFIQCRAEVQYCLLVKTSKTHDYYCQQLPADCTTPAPSKYDCGCFKNGDEIFVTVCK